MRRRKARRAPPPPGLLAEQSEEPSPEQPKRTSDPSPAPPERPEPQRPLDSARLVHAEQLRTWRGRAGGWWSSAMPREVARMSAGRDRPHLPAEGRSSLKPAAPTRAAPAWPPRRSRTATATSAALAAARLQPQKRTLYSVSEKRTLYSVKRRDSNAQLKLECRLEKELEAARERERALEAALRQRSEAFSELFVCPITHEPMQDPVSAADGQTYERRAIEEWLKKGDLNGGVPTSPLTGEPLKDKTLRPNFLARALRAGIA